jgi:hypothetical protein
VHNRAPRPHRRPQLSRASSAQANAKRTDKKSRA